MTTTYPTETLSFNEWMLYIHKENVRIRIQKIVHYEQNLSSKKSVSHYQRRVGQSSPRRGVITPNCGAETKND